MERLTYVTENGEVLFHPADLPDDEGMTITQLAENGRYKDLEEIAERLASKEQVEEQGLPLKSPCKVGDTVYAFLSTCNYFTECQINKIELKPTLYGNTCYFLEPIGHRGCLYRCFEDDFGKTVFLTKEEAEAKLKEMEGSHDGE